MKKSFYSNLAFLLFVNLLVKPFWILGIDRSVQNAETVGTADYGLYFSLFGIAFIFQIILDFGIANYNNRSVAQDENFIGKNLSNILALKLALAVMYAVIIFCAAVFLRYESRQVFLLALIAATQIIQSFLLYARSNISGMHLFRIDSLLSVTDKLLMIIACGFLLWGPFREHFSIEWFIYAQIASLLITLAAAFAIVIAKTDAMKLQWDFSETKEMLKKTYPYALLGLLMSVYYRVDAVMLERMLPDGAHEAGVYAASFRLMDAANNMLGVLFAALLLPMFARMLRDGKDVHELAGSSFKTIMATASFIAIPCFFYRQEIIAILYPASDAYWAGVFGMLMPAFLGTCVVYIYGTLLTANGSMKTLNGIALCGMALNIALNFILIPQHKAHGAALATLITQTLAAIAHVYAVKKIIPFKADAKQIVLFLIFISVMIGLFYGIKQIEANWMWGILTGVITGLVLAVLMGVFTLSGMKRMNQMRK